MEAYEAGRKAVLAIIGQERESDSTPDEMALKLEAGSKGLDDELDIQALQFMRGTDDGFEHPRTQGEESAVLLARRYAGFAAQCLNAVMGVRG
jgi:hypothetical protein